MARTSMTTDGHTYLPDEQDEASIDEFASALRRLEHEPVGMRCALVSADERRIEVPPMLFEVLTQVAKALSEGMGVSVAPLNAMLTTQEAADFLGISRPTFVRILDRGEIPMERPGRHRYVRLSDLIAHQENVRLKRRRILDEMARDSEAVGLYDSTTAEVRRPVDVSTWKGGTV